MDLAEITRRLDLETLYADYAACLDSDALERWPDFFTETCHYRVTSAENYEARQPADRHAARHPALRMTRLQPTKSSSRPSQARRLWAAVAFILALVVAFFPAETVSAAGPVVVASKIDTEGALLGNMIADVVAARGIAVDRRIQLGPTNIVRA